MSDNLDAMYRDVIMDHYRNPRGKSAIEHPDVHIEGKNPSCGDELEMDIKFDEDGIEDIHVGCVGCAISVSSGSMMAEMVKGKSLNEVKKIARVVQAMLKGEEFDEDMDLGDLEALEGVKKFPVRIKCALLSWTALMDSIEEHEHSTIPEEPVKE